MSHDLLLRLALNVQPEDEPGLDTLKVQAVPFAGKAEGHHVFLELLVAVEHVRVDLHEVAPALLGHLCRAVEQLPEHVHIVDVAHRATGGVQHGVAAGHSADQDGQRAPDGAALIFGQHAPPVPLGLGGGPVGGLQKMPLGMGGDEGFQLAAALGVVFGNDLIHRSHLRIRCIFDGGWGRACPRPP